METTEKEETEAGVDDWAYRPFSSSDLDVFWLNVSSDPSYIIVDLIRLAKAESGTLKLNTGKTGIVFLCFCCWMSVCRLQPIFEAAAKKGNNTINRIQFLSTTAVVTVTMWHIRQQGGCVSSVMTKSVSSRDPKKIRMGRKARLDLGSVRPRLWHGCNLQNAPSGGYTHMQSSVNYGWVVSQCDAALKVFAPAM